MILPKIFGHSSLLTQFFLLLTSWSSLKARILVLYNKQLSHMIQAIPFATETSAKDSNTQDANCRNATELRSFHLDFWNFNCFFLQGPDNLAFLSSRHYTNSALLQNMWMSNCSSTGRATWVVPRFLRLEALSLRIGCVYLHSIRDTWLRFSSPQQSPFWLNNFDISLNSLFGFPVENSAELG